jgi:hypothetical protein
VLTKGEKRCLLLKHIIKGNGSFKEEKKQLLGKKITGLINQS